MTAPRTPSRYLVGPLVSVALLTATACQDGTSLDLDPDDPTSSDDGGLLVATSLDAEPVPFKGALAATEEIPGILRDYGAGR